MILNPIGRPSDIGSNFIESLVSHAVIRRGGGFNVLTKCCSDILDKIFNVSVEDRPSVELGIIDGI